MEKWRQVGTNMDPKSMCNAKSDVLNNSNFSSCKTILLNVLAIKIRTKNNPKSIKNEVNIRRSLGIDV